MRKRLRRESIIVRSEVRGIISGATVVVIPAALTIGIRWRVIALRREAALRSRTFHDAFSRELDGARIATRLSGSDTPCARNRCLTPTGSSWRTSVGATSLFPERSEDYTGSPCQTTVGALRYSPRGRSGCEAHVVAMDPRHIAPPSGRETARHRSWGWGPTTHAPPSGRKTARYRSWGWAPRHINQGGQI